MTKNKKENIVTLTNKSKRKKWTKKVMLTRCKTNQNETILKNKTKQGRLFESKQPH